MSTPSDVQAVIDLEIAETPPRLLETGQVSAVSVPAGGSVALIDLTGDQHQERPLRKSGTTVVRDADSFVTYVEKHHTEGTEIYADTTNHTVTAVLNAHDSMSDLPNWCDHLVRFETVKTKSWKEWTGVDGQQLRQEQFAEFIEDHTLDVRSPSSAEMLEVAQSLIVNRSVAFESTKRLQDGRTAFQYREESAAKAGQTGELEIPEELELVLQPFEGAAPQLVTARFRYRLNGGNLTLGYKLNRPDDVIRSSFDDIVAIIGEKAAEASIPVLYGVPASTAYPKRENVERTLVVNNDDH